MELCSPTTTPAGPAPTPDFQFGAQSSAATPIAPLGHQAPRNDLGAAPSPITFFVGPQQILRQPLRVSGKEALGVKATASSVRPLQLQVPHLLQCISSSRVVFSVGYRANLRLLWGHRPCSGWVSNGEPLAEKRNLSFLIKKRQNCCYTLFILCSYKWVLLPLCCITVVFVPGNLFGFFVAQNDDYDDTLNRVLAVSNVEKPTPLNAANNIIRNPAPLKTAKTSFFGYILDTS